MSGTGSNDAQGMLLEDRRVQVQLSGLSGSLGVVEASATDTLGSLREKIAEQCDIPVFEQQLVLGTNVVEERYGSLEGEQLQKLFPTAESSLNLTVLRVVTPASVEDLVRRKTAQLLMTVSAENFETLMGRFHDEVVLESGEHLEIAVGMIGGKARVDLVQVYVDILSSLHRRYPVFPPTAPGERPVTLKGLLLIPLQFEFEQLMISGQFASTQALAPEDQSLQSMLSLVKLVGLLHVGKLVPVKLVAQLGSALLAGDSGEDSPPEHCIHCACAMLQSCGFEVEQRQDGQILMRSFMSRFKELQRHPGYSQEIVSMMQGLVDLQANQWVIARPPGPLPIGLQVPVACG